MVKRRLDCRVCKSKNLLKIWDFGMTPLANSYVDDVDKEELFFPLQVNQCSKCGNVQLVHVVDPELMFKNYLYTSSTSPVFVKHFKDFAKKMGKKRFIVDIGGNDGILLRPFKKMGCMVLNIEPSDIECDLPTIRKFFTKDLVEDLIGAQGCSKADLITATNVFAHIDDLDEVVEGVKILLDTDGIFVVEVVDLDQMLKDGTFDLIYHEHVNYWSEKAFRKFFQLRGMEVIEVEHTPVHGGSLRVYARVSR